MARHLPYPRSPRTWLIWAMLSMVAVSFVSQYVRWQSLAYNGLDLGIYTQVVNESSQGNLFAFSIHPHSYLGDHVELLLLGLVPLFWIVAHPLWLLFAQTLVLALGALPVYRFAARRLNAKWALGLALAYLFSPFVWNVNAYEFHMLPFAIPLLLAAIEAYDRSSLRWFSIWGFLALLVREDVALVVFGIGAVAALERRNWRWWLLPMLVSLHWFAFCLYLTSTAGTLGQYKFLSYYGWLGPDLVSIIGNFFGHPWLVLQRLFHPQAIAFLIGLGLPFAFLPIFRLRWLIPTLPIYFQLALSGTARELSLQMHYVSLFVPFLWIAAIFAIVKLRNEGTHTRRGRLMREYAAVTIAILVVVAAYSFVVIGPIRGFVRALYPSDSQREYAQLSRDVLEKIPTNEPLATGYRMISWTATRPQLYSLHYLYTGRQQYSETPFPLDPGIRTLLIDQQDFVVYQSVYPEDDPNVWGGAKRFRDLISERGLKLELMLDTYLLYTASANEDVAQPVAAAVLYSNTPLAEYENGLRLHSWQGENQDARAKLVTEMLSTNPYHTLPIRLTWSQQQMVTRHNALRLTLTKGDGETYVRDYPLAALFPQSEWELNAPMATSYRFFIPNAFATTETEAKLDVIAVRGKLTLDEQRSIVPRYTEYRVLGTIDLGNLILSEE